MEGFLLIDKPKGPTSHDVVDVIRRVTGVERVGHAGTLDPFATGLLLIGVGRTATREFSKLVGLDKEYEAVFVLGASSDTDDGTGRIVQEVGSRKVGGRTLDVETIKATLEQFVGEIEQMPPAYSAVKVGGRKSYEAARKGEALELKPRRVTVYSFVILNEVKDLHEDSSSPSASQNDSILGIHVRITCSSGTYIRALARDLGRALGTGGYVQELRRTRIGPFTIAQATTLEHITSSNWQNLLLANKDIPLLK